MSTPGEVVNQVAPALIRLARAPGAILLAAATLAVGSFAALGLIHGLGSAGARAWLPFALAALLSVPVIVLAVRRHRLHAQVASVTDHPTIHPPAGSAATPERIQSDDDALSAARAEGRIRTARVLPRVEAAQRAALAAAGGPIQAPYLKDDLRITLVALLATLAAIPLGTLGAIVTAILLLR
mgnify:CR=1 FL=1